MRRNASRHNEPASIPSQIEKGTLIKKENAAKNYPGVYSLWIKKSVDGWTLAFNERVDVWGTMYDPASDVAEISIGYKDTEEPIDMMDITLEDRNGGAILRIAWGKHQWITAFDPVPGNGYIIAFRAPLRT